MKKVAVFGNAGGGKSTLSPRLADMTGLLWVPLDSMKYKPGGNEVPHAESDRTLCRSSASRSVCWVRRSLQTATFPLMQVTTSVNGVSIRLTDERWQHIISRHPELVDQQEKMLEAIAKPDQIQAGDTGELLAIRFYSQTPLTSKFMVVAYREISVDDGFILTAYFTNRPSTRRITLWTQ